MYLLMKALHVAAVITWMAGLLLQALALKAVAQQAQSTPPSPMVFLNSIAQWDRQVTTPAMALVWVLGIAMAVQAHWFGTGWLSLKLVLVVALSALHGFQSGRIRRAVRQPASATNLVSGKTATLILVAGLVIAMLVITKPF